MFAARPPVDRHRDTHAPPLAEGATVRGGAALVAAQGDCPFKAVAAFRLDAEPWPDPIDGLSAMERGNLVHDALARFWQDVRTQAALSALSSAALDESIANHVDAAIRALDPVRRRSLPAAVFAQESPRIAALLRAWLTGFELARTPFSVESVEQRIALALTGLLLTLRIDRIDALDDGGVAIIDYKTGEIDGPARWIEARPRAPQLGLYALAYGAAMPEHRLRAVVYARLRRGEIKVEGIAADPQAWKGLHAPGELPESAFAGWADVEAHWRSELGALGAELRSGLATVTPRNVATTCRQCQRHSLCRIGSAAIAEEEGGGDE
jgi:RecB family exonuclease